MAAYLVHYNGKPENRLCYDVGAVIVDAATSAAAIEAAQSALPPGDMIKPTNPGSPGPITYGWIAELISDLLIDPGNLLIVGKVSTKTKFPAPIAK